MIVEIIKSEYEDKGEIMFEKEDVFCEDCEHFGFIEHHRCMLLKNKKTIKGAVRRQEVFGKCVDLNVNNDCKDYKECSARCDKC